MNRRVENHSSRHPLRIALVYEGRPLGISGEAAAVVPNRLAAMLHGRVEVHVVCGEDVRRHLSDSIVSHRLPVGRFLLSSEIMTAVCVYRVCKRYRIDVVQNVWAHHRLLWISCGARAAGAKVLARIVGVPIGARRVAGPIHRLRRWIGLRVERASLGCANGVHVISDALRETYRDRGVPPAQMYSLPVGFDQHLFNGLPGTPPAELAPLVLFVGRLVPTKCVDVLLRAVADLVSRGTSVRCRVIGDGPLLPDLKALADHLGISRFVEFSGFIPHAMLARAYSEATMLVLPSRWEGLGNVVVEAMASGLPVVASRAGGIEELLQGDRGILVPSGDSDALAAAMLWLIVNPERRRAMAKAALAYAREWHAFEALAPKYELMYRAVAGAGR